MTQHTGWGPQPWGGGWMPPPPPQPGVVPLRPLTLGDVIGGSFSAFGRYWKPLLGVALAFQGLITAVTALLAGLGYAFVHQDVSALVSLPEGSEVPERHLAPILAWSIPLGIFVLVTEFLCMLLIATAATAVVQEAVTGRPLTFGALWRRSWSRLPSVLGTYLLTMLVVAVPLLPGLAVLVAAIAAESSTGSGRDLVLLAPLLFLAALPACVWIGVRLLLAPAVAVCENLGPVRALRRSAHLVRGDWWRTFGIALVGGLIAGAVGYVIQMPFAIAGVLSLIPTSLSAEADGGSVLGLVIGMFVYAAFLLVGMVVSQIFQIGYMQLVTGLLYVDQRLRREDLASALLPGYVPPAPPAYGPPPGAVYAPPPGPGAPYGPPPGTGAPAVPADPRDAAVPRPAAAPVDLGKDPAGPSGPPVPSGPQDPAGPPAG
ncbi:hypothetical protein [Streptomyces sp. NPDC097619]|uniref:hypothetical protein n=1 Tax=Streptomyces sp. NPDC097619 TaxID=3157228 RepID=UPI0033298782